MHKEHGKDRISREGCRRFAMPVQGAVETATVPNTHHTESPDWQRKDVYGGEIDMRVDKAT